MHRVFSTVMYLIGVITLLNGSLAWADTYYIRMSGNDSNNGTSPATAFATPEKIGEIVDAGDTVYFGAGVYSHKIEPKNSGTLANPIRFIADMDGSKTGDAGVVKLEMSGSPIFSIKDISYIVVEGFTIMKGQGPFYLDKASSIVIRDCTIWDSEKHGIEIKESSDVLIEGCSIGHSREEGIWVENCASLQIIGCEIKENKKKGIKIKKAGSSAIIDRCVLYKNGDHGLGVEENATVTVTNTLADQNNKDGFHTHKNCVLKIWNCTSVRNNDKGIKVHDGGTIEIVNTIVYGNKKEGIDIDSKKKKVNLTLHHNLSFGNNKGNWKGVSKGSTDLSVDPKFTSLTSYKLASDSPAINAGTSASAFTDHDLMNLSRPGGAGWDIGCHEEGTRAPPFQYVRKNGSDANDGLTPETALKTIQKAIGRCTGPGCTIYVGSGVYNETLEIGIGQGLEALDGTAFDPNTIIADVAGKFTTDEPGEVVIDGKGTQKYGVHMDSRLGWVVHGFAIRGQTEYGVYGVDSGVSILNCTIGVPTKYAVYVTSMGDVRVEDCVFERDNNSSHMVWIQPINGSDPTSVTISRNDMTLKGDAYHSSGLEAGWSSNAQRSWGTRYTYGIVVYGWNSPNGLQVEISNNQVSDSYLPIYSGITNSPNSSSFIANNTIVSSFYGIYSYMNNSGPSRIINNIVDTTYFGTLARSYRCDPPVVEKLLENNITYSMARYNRPFEFEIITGSPVYMDAPGGDFSLAGRSPGVDAGTNRHAPGVDLNGNSRPTDGNGDGIAMVDLGAYETINTPTRVRVVRWREVGSELNR